MSAVPKDARSLGELFSELSAETKHLVRQEINLARTEMAARAAAIGKGAGLAAGGAVVAWAGFLALTAALIVGLGHLIGFGFSALIVGIILAGAGTAVLFAGLKKIRQTSLAPRETQEQLKETSRWAARQI